MLTSTRGEKLLKIRNTPKSQVLVPQGSRKGEEEHTHRHTFKTYVEEDQTGSGYTYAEKEGVEGGKERRNGGRVIGGRGKMGSTKSRKRNIRKKHYFPGYFDGLDQHLESEINYLDEGSQSLWSIVR